MSTSYAVTPADGLVFYVDDRPALRIIPRRLPYLIA